MRVSYMTLSCVTFLAVCLFVSPMVHSVFKFVNNDDIMRLVGDPFEAFVWVRDCLVGLVWPHHRLELVIEGYRPGPIP